MAKVKLIIGLPGSGKTYFAKTKYPKFTLIDDPGANKDALLLMMYHLNVTKWDLVVTDPILCAEKDRNKAIELFISKGYEVECVYFENDPQKCRKNLVYRNDGRNISSFTCFSYKIPDNVETIKIWQPK